MWSKLNRRDFVRSAVGASAALGVLSKTGKASGRVLTVNRMIATREEKLQLGEMHKASVCDMESAIVAEICQLKRVAASNPTRADVIAALIVA